MSTAWERQFAADARARAEVAAATERDVRGDFPDVDDVTVAGIVAEQVAAFDRDHGYEVTGEVMDPMAEASVIVAVAAARVAAERGPTEFCVVLDGNNVVAGFASPQDAEDWARATWGWDGTEGDTRVAGKHDSPVVLIAAVSRAGDWQHGSLWEAK